VKRCLRGRCCCEGEAPSFLGGSAGRARRLEVGDKIGMGACSWGAEGRDYFFIVLFLNICINHGYKAGMAMGNCSWNG